MGKLIDLNGLGHFKDKENAMVASVYSATKTYAVGDYAYYNGTLYRCTTAITTAEAWTSGHWTAAKIGDDVTELKTALNEVVEKKFSKNRYDGTYTAGGYVTPTNGTITNVSNHTYTPFIDISNHGNNSVYVTAFESNAITASNFRYAFYDETETFIPNSGGVTPTFVADSSLGCEYTQLTTPSNAYYLRFSYTSAGFTTRQWQVEYTTATPYEAYTGDYKSIKTDVIDENPLVKKLSSMTFNKAPAQAKAATLTNGQSLVVENNSVMKNQYIAFFAKLSGTFNGVSVGHGTGTYGYYITVDDTNMSYCSNGSVGTAIPHGLTFSEYIGVIVEVDVELNIKTTIVSDSDYFTRTQQINSSWRGDVFATSIDTSFADAVLTWNSNDYKCPLWAFGDSYFTLYATSRWPYYIANKWGFNNVLLNAYPGENSTAGYNDFVNAVKHGTPKYVLWCLGMNDPDTTDAINANWLSAAQSVKSYCQANEIELIFCTIPIVTDTNYKNTLKNEWIRNSGVRYVDMANALADVDGWLSEDGIHPSAIGGRFMAMKLLSDVPEICQGK